MKLLFISSKDVNKKFNGGFQCTNRNYLSFCNLLGAKNVKVIKSGRFKEELYFKEDSKTNLLFVWICGGTVS